MFTPLDYLHKTQKPKNFSYNYIFLVKLFFYFACSRSCPARKIVKVSFDLVMIKVHIKENSLHKKSSVKFLHFSASLFVYYSRCYSFFHFLKSFICLFLSRIWISNLFLIVINTNPYLLFLICFAPLSNFAFARANNFSLLVTFFPPVISM